METKVDVLAALDAEIARETEGTFVFPRGRKFIEVRAAVAELVEAHKDLLDTVERLDTAEGVCCCGDDMERHAHPMSCGHEPVDAGHYYHGAVIERSREALARITPAAQESEP